MKKRQYGLKDYFIPHADNGYHPCLLHTNRTVFYSSVFLLTKIIVVIFVILLPVQVFVAPDILAEEEKQIVNLTNKVRADQHLPALKRVAKLNQSAEMKAEDMATNNYFAHSTPGTSLADWLKAVDYKYEVAGENLALGFSTAEEVVNAWKKSPAHSASLIDPDFKEVGIGITAGIYQDKPTYFIVQHLAAPVGSLASETVGDKRRATPVAAPTASVAVAPPTVLADQVFVKERIADPAIGTSEVTVADKYIHAKKVMRPITAIFGVAEKIYLVAIGFFAAILLLSLMLEFKRRHPRMVWQSVGLILLLILFWRV